MLVLTIIGLFAGIFGVAVAFYQGMTQAIESRKLSTAIGVAYSRCADSATQMANRMPANVQQAIWAVLSCQMSA